MMITKRLVVGTCSVLLVAVAAALLFVTVQQQRQVERGAELAAVYCSACHLEPAPEFLPRRSWVATLGYMGYWLGIEDTDFLESEPSFVRANVRARLELLRRDGVFPAAPVLDEDDWESVRRYYLERAPRTPLPQADKPALEWGLPAFRRRTSEYQLAGAVTTLVHIRESTSEIYIGDSRYQTLTTLAGDGSVKVILGEFSPAISPVDIVFMADTAYVASIGDLMASEAAESGPAHIAALPLVDQPTATVVLDGLYRMADMEVADVNGDGSLDFVVAGFGNSTGAVSWFESSGEGSYEEHVLLDLSGSVKVETHDFNADGLLDIMVLVSNSREGLHLFINEGGSRFSHQLIFETPSTYGHTAFQLLDFNDDGLMDVLAVNGDNVDSDPYNTLKNYHGVRIYLNRGEARYEEAYFYPMYGALNAEAADFDEDGDLDIAAISFYPDFASERRESFTYLENQGDLNFMPFTNEEALLGRWMTMDVGDIDGDTDVDIVLGGAYLDVGMSVYPEVLARLRETGPSILILENTRR